MSLWSAARRGAVAFSAGIAIATSLGAIARADTTVVYADTSTFGTVGYFNLPAGVLKPNQTLFVLLEYGGFSDFSGNIAFNPSFGEGYTDRFGTGPTDYLNNYHTMFVDEPLCYTDSCLQPTPRPQEYAAVLHGPTLYDSVYDCVPPNYVSLCLLWLGTPAITGEVGFTYDAMAPDAFIRITFSDQPISVPEPAAWALLVLGFGGIGAALRRARLGLRRQN
jgi:hypothetical protein